MVNMRKFVRWTSLIVLVALVGVFIYQWKRHVAAWRMEAARSHLREGNALMQEGKAEQALAAWREATRLSPHIPEPYIARGNYYWGQRQFRRAADEFSAAHRLKPNDVEILLALIQTLTDAGNRSQIEPLARRAVALAPDNPKAHAYLGIFLSHASHRPNALAEAERELKVAHRTSPGMPIPVIELGKLYCRMVKWKEAGFTLLQAWDLLHQGTATVRYLESAAEVESRKAETAYSLGLVCRQLKQNAAMERWFARFRECNTLVIKRSELQLRLSRNPDDVQALLDLTEMNLQAGSPYEAADALRRALRLRPDDRRGQELARRLTALNASGWR